MAKHSISMILSCLLLLTITPPSHSNNQTDFEALLSIKKSIHTDPLGALASWNETTPFCEWKGVVCSKRHPDRVISLSLRSLRLVGDLSPHVGNLSFLKILDLKNNTFRGPIPQEIGRLRRLQMIEFSNNSFIGGIPRNISQCTNLHYLNLINNQLNGSIIHELSSLHNLQDLGLTTNAFSGTIPPFLGNLTSLVQLSLAACGLQGEIPESLARLRRMEWFNARENSLTGRIPLGLYNLSGIEVFSLGSNRLHGTIPSDIVFTLPKLRILDLADNLFHGELPSSLSNSSRIEHLYVELNNFTGETIDVGRLSSLRYLLASTNRLKGDVGTILSSLTNSTSLEVLTLDHNLFTGSLPYSIANLSTTLWALDISVNRLSGSIPSSVGNLVGITFLNAASCDLEGPIPSSIGELYRLQEIYLDENKFTNEMPQNLGNLTSLNVLGLSRNSLSGRIPQSLGNCRNLGALDLSHNNLNGSIPSEIMKLSSISISLDLSHNFLIGTIPLELGSLRNLGVLDLSQNRLSGSVPSSLSSCVMLERLRLGSNSLEGEIPDSLKALRGLQDLDLSMNNFWGTIPRFLGGLPLMNLNLSFNALSGEVPTMGVFVNGSAVSIEGNPGLCGGIAVLSLPSCSSPTSDKRDFKKILIPTVGATCILVLAASFALLMFRRRRRETRTPDDESGPPTFPRLSFEDLLNATGRFSESNLLGAGRFGSVYRGIINVERIVAVKVLNLNVRGASKSLVAECNALRGVRHRNLVKILSVCDSIDFKGQEFKALVYEFMGNGSLEDWLHKKSDQELTFIQRLNIAIDIASAVEYLHNCSDSAIVHGDLKPSNILLDEDMVAHVGDFGLAKIISSISADSTTSDVIKGTIGYIPPEYGMHSVASTQGDVYSYGILLLEIFTNRRPTGDAFEGHANLQRFVSSGLPEVVLHNFDEKYKATVVPILSIGVKCAEELPRDRMPIARVLNELNKIRNTILDGSKTC